MVWSWFLQPVCNQHTLYDDPNPEAEAARLLISVSRLITCHRNSRCTTAETSNSLFSWIYARETSPRPNHEKLSVSVSFQRQRDDWENRQWAESRQIKLTKCLVIILRIWARVVMKDFKPGGGIFGSEREICIFLEALNPNERRINWSFLLRVKS